MRAMYMYLEDSEALVLLRQPAVHVAAAQLVVVVLLREEALGGRL